MNVYFTASIVGKKKYLENYNIIIDLLKKNGNSVASDHIINTTEHAINMESVSAREKFHKKLKRWIMESQCMVVEASFPSISVGFEISLALQLNKPVLLLYTEEAPTLLSGYDNEQLLCERYTFQDVKSILEDFLSYVKGKGEHRFTFFIPTYLSHFLEEVSKKKNIPKSVYLRQLIEKAKNK
jgi:hypothetical protein